MFKKIFNPTLVISLELALIAMSISSMIISLVILPDHYNKNIAWQNQHAKSLAMQFSLAIQTGRDKTVENLIDVSLKQFPELASIAIKSNNKTLISSPNHQKYWEQKTQKQKAATNITIEIPRAQGTPIELAICYKVQTYKWYQSPGFRTGLYIISGTFIMYLIFIRKMFRKALSGETASSTERVNEIFNTMSEAVVVLDKQERIILANNEFLELIDKSFPEIKETKINNQNWLEKPAIMPWTKTINEKTVVKGAQMSIQHKTENSIILANTTPIIDKDNTLNGVMVTLNDVTELHKQNEKIKVAMAELKENHKKIQAQNETLKEMSMKDPLTGCLNRRAFFELFESEWSGSKRHGYELSCIMLDIDFFKKINDNYGHSKGDEVLRVVPQVIRENIRKTDLVCRYGGEEFCLLMPHTDIAAAAIVAEKIRLKVEESNPGEIHTTMSIGISSAIFDPKSPQDLIDQADKALYFSKANGRNQHTRWDEIPEDMEIVSENQKKEEPKHFSGSTTISTLTDIPFQAVNALITALEQRDAMIGMHSRRVADLCVAIARDIMDHIDLYILEVAALLHDIGKIGVPDSILTKSTELSKTELATINYHMKNGAKILENAFHSSELTGIIKYNGAWFGGTPGYEELPVGENIPLRSRIIYVATAYDSMITDSVYRQSKTPQEAIAELKENSPKQFDPWVVSRLEEIISARREERAYMIPDEEDIKALRIGLEIEKLICAAEAEDIAMMSTLASSLANDATKLDIPEVAYPAAVLSEGIEKGKRLSELLQLVNELISECNRHQEQALKHKRKIQSDIDHDTSETPLESKAGESPED